MLGKKIKVYVNEIHFGSGKDSRVPPVCLGYFTEGEKNNKVFVVGVSSPAKTVIKAKIIAVIYTEEGHELYVAAPFGKVYYEPYLRKLLTPFISGEFKIVCHFEKSCGAVVFRRKSGNIEYLIIKNKRGTNWGFPKGHVELGESETDTAIREVREETGLNILPLEGFRVVNEYHPHGNVSKRVVLFLAEHMGDQEIVIQQSEVERFIWADFSLAQHTFKFNNDRYVLTRARDFISGKGK
ncbi:MAG: NUDIX domain-containing protein [Clostridia bacterium]|nr:NUDIX domain-containing protein [Clostridia bacterium]